MIVLNLSHAKLVYVLTKSHLSRFKNMGMGRCVKCFLEFKENDIIATSTSQHYCYPCAVKINLVTGQIAKDLHNDEFIPKVLHQIKLLSKKLSIPIEIYECAQVLINTVFEKSYYVSKNEFGLACAAISLAFRIKKKDDSVDIQLPVEDSVLQRNLHSLQKNLESVNIYSLSEKNNRMKN